MTPPLPPAESAPSTAEPLVEGWLAPVALAGHALLGFTLARTRGHYNGDFIFVVAAVLLLWLVGLGVSRPVRADTVRARTRAWARHAQLACLVLGAFFLWRTVRRRVEPGDPLPELLVACLLFHPRGLFMLEQAWGEPLALPFLGAFVYFLGEGRKTAAAVALGLLCATKQHFVLYLPFALLLPGLGWRGTAPAGGMALATFLPFLVWTPGGLWKDLVVHHLTNPFRPDSLSLGAWLLRRGQSLPGWLGFVGTGAVWALTLARRRGPETLLLGSAVAFGVFFFLGRQAFCNYYYQVGATVLAAVVLSLDSRPARAVPASALGRAEQTGAAEGPPLAA